MPVLAQIGLSQGRHTLYKAGVHPSQVLAKIAEMGLSHKAGVHYTRQPYVLAKSGKIAILD